MRNIGKFALTAALVTSFTLLHSVYAQDKQPASQQTSGQVSISTVKPPENQSLKLFLKHSNQVGLTYADDSINKTSMLIQKNRLPEAKAVIEPVADWLEDATEYHTNLYKVLKDIDTAKSQADLERDLALKSAILRDKALYQLSLLYIEEKNPKKAVPKLVDIVRSQPKTQLGFSAYQVLQQIGFTYKIQMPTAEQLQSAAEQANK